ncbi:GNAT family N-acetyltransferase [Arthrobacter sp. MYb227]|uniref:GNAT family N-acetyltransferase n=1 Tax=Arthrobacter sp. MYb227 TaxID=1848601 RepID=UPI000CFC33C6|nr:GNAT family N-acetyltransferase [Arthrobacter sp. MYb227]PQZ93546.1 GNAT family N-acetyltransferase [Arthrobacter sp. MYb227]
MIPLTNVRRAQVLDAEGIAHVHVQAWREAYSHLLPAQTLAGLQEQDRVIRWRDIVGGGETKVWVALEDEVVVGWASTSTGRDNDAPCQLELEGIYVLASHHGSGTGQALFNASIGNQQAYLWMAADNPRALTFYQRNGFQRDGTTEIKDLAGTPVPVMRLSR